MSEVQLKDLLTNILDQLKPITNISDHLVESVIRRLKEEYVEPHYINYVNDIFRMLDMYDDKIEDEDRINIIKNIGMYNDNFYNKEEAINKKHKAIESKTILKNDTFKDKVKTIFISNSSKELIKNNNFEYANSYYKLVNDNRNSLSKVEKIILSVNENDRKIICKRIAINLLKEINQMNILLNDKTVSYSKEEMEEFKSEILQYNKLYDFINDYCDIEEKFSIEETNIKKRLIFPQLNANRSFFLSDVDGQEEYYFYYAKQLELLEKDRANFKKLGNHLIFNGLMESRAGETRIIYDYFDSSSYIIIAAFIKKCMWDNRVITRIESDLVNYKNYMKKIKEVLVDEKAKQEFYKYQDKVCTDTIKTLKDNARGM